MAVLAVICALVINTLACSYSDTAHWYETVSYQSPTPNLTSVFDEQQTATQMVGKINQTVGKISVTVVLDPLNERDVTGVQIAASDINQYLMIETHDPQGRYLPDLEIVSKSSQYRDSQQTVIAQQIDKAWTWSYKIANSINIAQVKTTLVGTVPLDQVGSSLVSSWPQDQPIHFILPVLDKYDGAQSYDVFRTPGNATLLLMPSGTLTKQGPGFKLARQVNPQVTPTITSTPPASNSFVLFNFAALPARPLTDYTAFIQNLTVGNYLNMSSADMVWGELKVNELGATGLPKTYIAPKTVTTDMMKRLTTDQQFVNSLYYLDNTQANEPCTKPEQLNRVLRQDPPAGTLINGIKNKVKLVICNQVLSQSKYLTAMYATPTPTASVTPRPTSTITRTPTSSATNTVLPSSTSIPTSTYTPAPTSTSAPTSTPVSVTATTGPTSTSSATAGPSPTPANTDTPTITPTPTARIFDDFNTAPNGFVPTFWATKASSVSTPPAPTLSWPGEERYKQEFSASNINTGSYTLFLKQQCLYGQAEFKLRLSSSRLITPSAPGDGANLITVGWEDDAGMNGIYVTAPENATGAIDTAYINFSSKYEGNLFNYTSIPNPSATANPNIYLGSNASGIFFIGRIAWFASSGNYTGETDLYLNGSDTPSAVINDDIGSATFKVPTKKMKFIIRSTTHGNDSSWVEVDYVKISSNNCQ